MPGIVAGALLAHPPILLPQVGGRESERVVGTLQAMRDLDHALARHPGDLVVVVSPHSPSGESRLPVRPGAGATGELSRFRAPGLGVSIDLDERLASTLVREGEADGFPLTWAAPGPLDHAVVVPLHVLERTRAGRRFLLLGISGWPPAQLVAFGAWLHRRLAGRSAILLASGDLSHRLTRGAPAGFRPEGRLFDDLVVDALGTQAWDRIESLESGFVERAGECGLRPLLILLGAARAAGLVARVRHYEGPFGVGYPVVEFSRDAAVGVDLQHLVRSAITHYLEHRAYLDPPSVIPDPLRPPRAVFVTLRRDGALRGCVGSTRPTQPTALHEIVHYAVAAALRDPRFPPVRREEVDALSASVQLLDEPEPVSGTGALDPARFGIIIRSGEQQALLLPGIVGIDTPEEQLQAACDKAGISRHAALEIFRFGTQTLV